MSDRPEHCVVVIGGDPPPPGIAAVIAPLVKAGCLVIAADSGADHALALGLHVDLLIGDLDSVTPAAVATVEATGGIVDRHSPDKAATDTELGLDAAVAAGHRRITVVSGGGGRLDHLLASLTVLARAALPDDVDLDAYVGTAHVRALRGPGSVTFDGRVGDIISLVPLDAAVDGVTTDGLRWPLNGEPLPLGTSRGTSNEMLTTRCTVTAATGTLLVVRPDALITPQQHPAVQPGEPA